MPQRLALLPFGFVIALLLSGCALSISANGSTRHPAAPSQSSLIFEQTTSTEEEPGVTVVRQVWQSTYAVSGADVDSIRASLAQRGPNTRAADQHFDALSEWGIRWSFRYQHSDGDCSLANARIEIEINVMVPDLVESDAQSADLITKWSDYRDAIDQHEQGHVQIELAAVDELAAEFADADAASNCTALGRLLNQIGEAKKQQIRDADAAYDAETSHGKLQGAVFK